MRQGADWRLSGRPGHAPRLGQRLKRGDRLVEQVTALSKKHRRVIVYLVHHLLAELRRNNPAGRDKLLDHMRARQRADRLFVRPAVLFHYPPVQHQRSVGAARGGRPVTQEFCKAVHLPRVKVCLPAHPFCRQNLYLMWRRRLAGAAAALHRNAYGLPVDLAVLVRAAAAALKVDSPRTH